MKIVINLRQGLKGRVSNYPFNLYKEDSVAAVKELISKKSHKFDLTQVHILLKFINKLPLLNLNANKERQTNNPQIQEKNLSYSKHLSFSPLFEGNKVNREKSDYNTEQSNLIFNNYNLILLIRNYISETEIAYSEAQ